MVVIHIKTSATDEFCYDTSSTSITDTVIRELCSISNFRLLLTALVDQLGQLSQFGPSKSPSNQGLDAYQQNDHTGSKFYTPDPLGLRTGDAPGPEYVSTINRVIEAARVPLQSSTSPLAIDTLVEKVGHCQGAVTMTYPMGLPDYDPVAQLLNLLEPWAGHSLKKMSPGVTSEPHESPKDVKLYEGLLDILAGQSASQSLQNPATASLWWAGKEFFREDPLSIRLGSTNEKVKLVAKLQGPGAGAPAREPAVSESERKSMMAYYFKKQEEMKALAEADTEDYLHSSWANPSALKNQLRRTGNIRPF